MECPKCNMNITILDYNDEFMEQWAIREWECKCSNCGYHGKYREMYKFDESEWERIEK